ncbi:MAG TPA: Crp/Fnr family transcriptional regulator [Pyrinomonadaceae bacterium]|nr:Crp/Fnr family transcriptional regulator [Pyrinomonadaceae bacterium]
MPSAQKIEIDKFDGLPMNQAETDSPSFLQAIHAANVSNLSLLHPRGKILFAEGEPARGVHVLRTGRVTVSISSSEGRVVILRLAQAGDVLGLNSVLQNGAYETTVKALEPCRTDFISCGELIELMRKSQTVTHAITKILSRQLAELTNRARSLVLPQTAAARLARLLLELSNENGVDKFFTHEEFSQMICSSRETVTRLLINLENRQIISVRCGSILIRDRATLQTIASV